MRVVGPILAFLLLPAVPTLALFVVPAGHIPVLQDRIVVCVLLGLAATVASGTIGYRRRRDPGTAILYGLGTAILCVVAFFIFIAAIFEYYCGDGDGSC